MIRAFEATASIEGNEADQLYGALDRQSGNRAAQGAQVGSIGFYGASRSAALE